MRKEEEIRDILKNEGLTGYKIGKDLNLSYVGVNKFLNGETKKLTKKNLELYNSYIDNSFELKTNTVSEPTLNNYNSLPGYERMKNNTIDDFIKQLKDTKNINLLSSNFDDKLTIFKLYINTLEQYKIAKKNHLNEK